MHPLAAMDSDKWFYVFMGLFMAVQWWKDQQAKKREAEAIKDRAVVASKVEEVKQDLKVNTDTTVEAAEGTKQVQKLLNGAKTITLRELADARREIATLEPTPDNVAKLAAAEKQLAAHEATQQ